MTGRELPELPSGFRELPDFPVFKAFAVALWKQQAAVMVGAGFSRVCKREPNSSAPPLWCDFKSKMETALGYGVSGGPDALRLAQEYQTLHGDDGLDRLIRDLVTDNQWLPGSLHKQLLEFPWQDILTTNWDTLLERTTPETPDRIYSCVRTIQDIAHQPKPRIVKLHGSLPSHKPLIFTEDDFRTYPTRFAPFVNLAQQVMLEHELCLVGFSGIDPNFLAWSGWVRDTLGVSTRRIRLVGALNLSRVSRSLLEARNVTPIDLGPLVTGVHNSEKHEKALELFFSALIASKPPSPYNWAMSANRFSAPHNTDDEEKVTRADVSDAWATDRRCYPGWIICPNRETHSLVYRYPTLRKAPESARAHLRFAKERIWRHRTAGIWLLQLDLKDADTHFEEAQASLSTSERVELCASIAAEWRRFQDWQAWARWMVRLEAIEGDEARFCHAYETGQRALLAWDDETVLKASRALNSDDPIWMMRRAGLLATLYHHREAAELYQSALRCIRQKQLAAPKSAWLISLEGWAAKFHWVSQSALTDDFYSFPDEDTDETRMRFLGAKAEPWDQISRLERMASDRIDRNRQDAEPWKLSFKPGQFRHGGTTRDGEIECPFYSLLGLMERTGAPEHISNFDLFSTRLETAFRAITNPDEDDMMAFLARYRGTDKKILDWVMPRIQVARLSDEAVDQLLSGILRRVDRLAVLNDQQSGENHITFLLELLARVLIRASADKALEIYCWGIKLLEAPSLWSGSYSACSAVLNAAIEAMDGTTRQSALDAAIHLRTPGEAFSQAVEPDWPEPIDAFSDDDAKAFNISPQTAHRVDELISVVKEGVKLDRTRAIRRLHVLFVANKLTDAQELALEDAIWDRSNDKEWPTDIELPPWIFLDLPSGDRATALFVKNIIEVIAEGSISHELLLNLRIGLKKLELDVGVETLLNCVRSCLAWVPTSMEGRSAISVALSGNVRSNRITAHEIGEVLARTLLPRLDPGRIPEEVTNKLLSSEELQQIPQLVSVAYQIARLWPDKKSRSLAMIRAALASRHPERVYPAYVAMMQYTTESQHDLGRPVEVIELLLHSIEQRTQPGLSYTLQLLGDLVEQDDLIELELERLRDALPIVLKEYHYEQRSLEVPSVADLPLVRRRVHRLTGLLSDKYSDLNTIHEQLGSDPLPEVRRTED